MIHIPPSILYVVPNDLAEWTMHFYLGSSLMPTEA